MSHETMLKMVQRSPDGSEWTATHYISMKIVSRFLSKEDMNEIQTGGAIVKKYGDKFGECMFWIVGDVNSGN